MRDKDHGLALRLERGDKIKQAPRLRNRQRRGWLVEDNNLGPTKDNASNLDNLLRADRKLAHAMGHIQIEAQFAQMGLRFLIHARPID